MSWLVSFVRIEWRCILFGSFTFLVGALNLLAAVPYFRGYIVLTRDRLIEYPALGLWSPREYRYDQICGVREERISRRPPFEYCVVIDYFKPDASGHLDVTRYYTRRLIQVEDDYGLLQALRARALARKFPFSRLAWEVILAQVGEVIATLILIGVVLIVMVILKK